MHVHKFGGTSLACGECFERVAGILTDSLQSQKQTAVVLSAPSGITNQLQALVEKAAGQSDFRPELRHINTQLAGIIETLEETLEGHPDADQPPGGIRTHLASIVDELEQRCSGIQLLGQCPDKVAAEMMCAGERFSAHCMEDWLNSIGVSTILVQPESFIVTTGGYLDAEVDLETSQTRFRDQQATDAQVMILPGYVGANENGETTLLGRNGSDFSAAILAACCHADSCQIWSDVDGIFSCDPRQSDAAQLLKEVSYEEAMELSWFGASVIHPKTIAPLLENQIPCRIRNTWKTESPGTLISGHRTDGQPAKAVSHVGNVAIINVSGPVMRTRRGVVGRMFELLSANQVPVFLVTQSSSQYSMSICIPADLVKRVTQWLDREFELELAHQSQMKIEVICDLAVISIVGDGMKMSIGIAAGFFQSLADADINVVAISQGSSERSISAVVRDSQSSRAICVCHENLIRFQSRYSSATSK